MAKSPKTSNTISSSETRKQRKRNLCGSHDDAEHSSDTNTNTTTKRLRGSHSAAEPFTNTNTNTKRLRGSHDPEVDSLPASKKGKVGKQQHVSPRQDTRPDERVAASQNKVKSSAHTSRKRPPSPSPPPAPPRRRPRMSAWLAAQGEQDQALRGADASTGAAETRKASSAGSGRPPQRTPPHRRFCWRCRRLFLEQQRARRGLEAVGVPVRTRCEVLALRGHRRKYLGKGSYGRCVKGRDPRTGQELVLKTFRKRLLQWLVHEAATLRKLRRVPGLQRLVGVCVKTRQLVSLFAGATLEDYFTATPRSAATALRVFLQAARTLQAMGEAGYAHNDVKPDNVCALEQEGRGGLEVTVIDLGVAFPVGTRGFYKPCTSTAKYPWLAPELLLGTGPCGEASDAYRLAFLMQEVLGHVERRPSLAPVEDWLGRAFSRDPDARPGLAVLREVLQTALEEEGGEGMQ